MYFNVSLIINKIDLSPFIPFFPQLKDLLAGPYFAKGGLYQFHLALTTLVKRDFCKTTK